MTTNVPIAKVACPRIRNQVPRQRLFDMLDTCRDYPILWICAPAGSGKTTLAASYLNLVSDHDRLCQGLEIVPKVLSIAKKNVTICNSTSCRQEWFHGCLPQP